MSKEILKDEKLDNVAGGTRIETFQDGEELVKRGLLNEEDALRAAPVRNLLHKLGYNGYEDKGGLLNANIYKDKLGKAPRFVTLRKLELTASIALVVYIILLPADG